MNPRGSRWLIWIHGSYAGSMDPAGSTGPTDPVGSRWIASVCGPNDPTGLPRPAAVLLDPWCPLVHGSHLIPVAPRGSRWLIPIPDPMLDPQALRGPLGRRIRWDATGTCVSVDPMILLDCYGLLLCCWIQGGPGSTDPTGSQWILLAPAGLSGSTDPMLDPRALRGPLGRRGRWDPIGS